MTMAERGAKTTQADDAEETENCVKCGRSQDRVIMTCDAPLSCGRVEFEYVERGDGTPATVTISFCGGDSEEFSDLDFNGPASSTEPVSQTLSYSFPFADMDQMDLENNSVFGFIASLLEETPFELAARVRSYAPKRDEGVVSENDDDELSASPGGFEEALLWSTAELEVPDLSEIKQGLFASR